MKYYYYLKVGDIIKSGDEFLNHLYNWASFDATIPERIGTPKSRFSNSCRRKILKKRKIG